MGWSSRLCIDEDSSDRSANGSIAGNPSHNPFSYKKERQIQFRIDRCPPEHNYLGCNVFVWHYSG
jgi:hypothetical protein